MTNTTQNFSDLKLWDMALAAALDNHLSDWEAFNTPQEAVTAIADGDDRILVCETFEYMDADDLLDDIESQAHQIQNLLKLVRDNKGE